MSEMFKIPILPAIRTDQSVNKAFRARKALLDFDPNSKASQDYLAAFEKITSVIEGANNGREIVGERSKISTFLNSCVRVTRI